MIFTDQFFFFHWSIVNIRDNKSKNLAPHRIYLLIFLSTVRTKEKSIIDR